MQRTARVVRRIAETFAHDSRRAFVEDEEDEHVGWARETRATLTLLQAHSSVMTAAGAKAEELLARVRNWFADR
jgi:hypothetical protein